MSGFEVRKNMGFTLPNKPERLSDGGPSITASKCQQETLALFQATSISVY